MRLVPLILLVLTTAGCSRTTRPSFPPPARPPVFIQLDFETAFNSLRAVLEARNYPLVVEDEQFGIVRTDWVEFGPGDTDVTTFAVCPPGPEGQEVRVRARFGFDVRRRTVNSTVTIVSHWQTERLRGFDDSDRSYADCRSTGEWERMIEGVLTQRGTIR